MKDYLDTDIIDCHIHMRTFASIANQIKTMETCGLAAVNALCVPRGGGLNINQNVLGALFKAMHPERVYWFGGLHHGPPAADQARPDFAGQLRRLIEMGCDGIKFLEGKPTLYKALGKPLTDPRYDEFHARMAERGIPLLFHLGDPSAYWDPARVSQWTRDRGWFYGDGTYPTREELYRQTETILDRFPGLKVIFAHFYFVEDDLAFADEMLHREGVHFDLTPGWTMYGCFSKAPDAWREFFIRHADKILFGTDNSGGRRPADYERLTVAKYRVWRMRAFLETDKPVLHEDGTFFQGLALPRDVIEKIYRGNFVRLAGERSRPVSVPLAIDECKRLISVSADADAETRTDLANILAGLEALA